MSENRLAKMAEEQKEPANEEYSRPRTRNSSAVSDKSCERISIGAHELVSKISIEGKYFKDEYGRILLLRGVNISGNSKLPLPNRTHVHPDFFKHRDVSFVERPFRIEQLDEHFSRLRSWGLTFVRLLCPWEALEHEGPGKYDSKYIKYIITVLKKAAQFGIKCFIDPHQDTWSRFSGGSGAPGWTFEVAGMDISKLEQAGAVHFYDFFTGKDDGKMVWPSNYTKLASATMFTLFFGGDIFAPKRLYKGESVQQFLQRCYYNCYSNLAKRLKGLSALIGFEAINEPHPGYIGTMNISSFDQKKDLHLSSSPTALQSWALGSGIPQEVDFYIKSWPWPTRKAGKTLINKGKVSVWLPGKECIWKEHGVWDFVDGKPHLLVCDYFSKRSDGSKVDFYNDCYVPFLRGYANAIKQVDDSLLFFFEPIPNEEPPEIPVEPMFSNTVYAPHWYDLSAVFSKSFDGYITHDVQALSKGKKNIFMASYFGLMGARRNYTSQISNVINYGLKKVGQKPCIIGECGIPMDINQKRAFASGDYKHHTNFLDAILSSLDANLVGYTLWNYNPINNWESGDMWNGEDFSIFTKEAIKEADEYDNHQDIEEESNVSPLSVEEAVHISTNSVLHSPYSPHTPFDLSKLNYDPPFENTHVGGRALDAVIRPYATKIAGIPISMTFTLKSKKFHFAFYSERPRKCTNNTTEIFIPLFHYKDLSNYKVDVSDGTWVYDAFKQTIYWTINPDEFKPNDKNSNSYFWFASPDAKRNVHSISIIPIVGKKWGSLLSLQ